MITPTVIILYEWILYRGFGSWSSSSHKWNDDDSMPGLVSPTRRGPVRAGIAKPGNNPGNGKSDPQWPGREGIANPGNNPASGKPDPQGARQGRDCYARKQSHILVLVGVLI